MDDPLGDRALRLRRVREPVGGGRRDPVLYAEVEVRRLPPVGDPGEELLAGPPLGTTFPKVLREGTPIH